MKKASRQARRVDQDELQSEYRLDYSRAKPNRFREDVQPGGIAVTLEPDVAKVFNTSESVNRALRNMISAVRQGEEQRPPKSRKAS
jgi:hypothetical protein